MSRERSNLSNPKMKSSQVEIVLKQLVKPSQPTPDFLKRTKLTFQGQLESFCVGYIPLILFYQDDQSPGRNGCSERSQQLRQSLSEVLSKFYTFAGRITGNDSVHCNDSGALYVEAHVHGDLSDAIQNANSEDLKMYLPIETYQLRRSNIEESNNVLLAVQISFFECGGMAVGVCLSHEIADMYCLVTFMNSWAEKCSGRTQISMQPNFVMGSHHFPPLPIPDDRSEDKKEQASSPAAEQKMAMKRFVFDKDILSAMKAQASSSSCCSNPTRVEVVSAFIWKHFIDIARAKGYDKKKTFSAFYAVNLRPRITPSIPDFAMGHLSILVPASSESDKSRDYFDLVSPLRTAVQNLGNNFCNSMGKKIEFLGLLLHEFAPENRPYTCIISSWCRFPYYEVDYGWGKPLSVCTIPAHTNNNTVILTDTRSGDGVHAWITMLEDEMAMLPEAFLALESNDFRY